MSKTSASLLKWTLLGVITLGAFLLRWWNIASQPLWADEALTLLVGQWPVRSLFFDAVDPTPALYYLLHKLFVGSAANVGQVRSISLIAGTSLVPVMFMLARQTRLPALAATLLAALSFPLIDYSQEARAYGLLVLIVALSATAYSLWHRSRSNGHLAWFTLFNMLAIYTHFVAIFWVVPIMVAAIATTWGDRDELGRVRLASLALILFTIPEAARIFAFPKSVFSWLGQASPLMAWDTIGSVFLPFGLMENDTWHFGPILSGLGILAMFGLLAWRAWHFRNALGQWRRENGGAFTIILVSLAMPLMIWLFGFVAKPIFMTRTILIAIPGFILALVLILKFERRSVIWAVVILYALNLAFTGTMRPKEDWRSATAILSAQVRDGDVVLLCPGWKAAAFRHAFHGHVNAPLLLDWNGRVMQVEPRLGLDRHWVETYFRTFQEQRGFEEGQAALDSAKRVWRVDSNCKHQ